MADVAAQPRQHRSASIVEFDENAGRWRLTIVVRPKPHELRVRHVDRQMGTVCALDVGAGHRKTCLRLEVVDKRRKREQVYRGLETERSINSCRRSCRLLDLAGILGDIDGPLGKSANGWGRYPAWRLRRCGLPILQRKIEALDPSTELLDLLAQRGPDVR
jgi:hypothetical protein